MIPLIINVVVLALALIIVSKITPIGVQIDSTISALIGGAIIGLFNGIGYFLPLTGTIGVLSLGIIPLIVSTIIFALAAQLVSGFRLVNGLWSALFGAISLAFVSSILNYLIGKFLPF